MSLCSESKLVLLPGFSGGLLAGIATWFKSLSECKRYIQICQDSLCRQFPVTTEEEIYETRGHTTLPDLGSDGKSTYRLLIVGEHS